MRKEAVVGNAGGGGRSVHLKKPDAPVCQVGSVDGSILLCEKKSQNGLANDIRYTLSALIHKKMQDFSDWKVMR